MLLLILLLLLMYGIWLHRSHLIQLWNDMHTLSVDGLGLLPLSGHHHWIGLIGVSHSIHQIAITIVGIIIVICRTGLLHSGCVAVGSDSPTSSIPVVSAITGKTVATRTIHATTTITIIGIVIAIAVCIGNIV